MDETISRAGVEAFYRAVGERDHETAARYLADDVVWTIAGPIDILPFCGTCRGKAAVLNLLERLIPATIGTRQIVAEAILVDGDRAAALSRLTGKRNDNGRSISYRLAQFFMFRDGKVVEYFAVLDSFDAVEQVIGHRIEMAPCNMATDADSNIVTV
jgi:ketosteroid isomerase-like protein